MSADTKVCPECAEEIKTGARVCRFCGYRFDVPAPSADRDTESIDRTASTGLPTNGPSSDPASADPRAGGAHGPEVERTLEFHARMAGTGARIITLREGYDALSQLKGSRPHRKAVRGFIDLVDRQYTNMSRQLSAPEGNPPPRWRYGEIGGELAGYAEIILAPVRVWVSRLLEVEVGPWPTKPHTPPAGDLSDEHLDALKAWLQAARAIYAEVNQAIDRAYAAPNVDESLLECLTGSASRAATWIEAAELAVSLPDDYVADPRDGGGLRSFELELLVLDAELDRAADMLSNALLDVAHQQKAKA